jgi:hypothetical protein
MSALWLDFCYTLRVLRRSPVFSVVAILSLALGIGGIFAIFTLINALLLRQLPVAHPEQLVQISRAARQQTAVVVRSADRLGSLVFRFLSGKYWSGADWLSIKTFFNISFTIASSPSHSLHPD